MTEGVSSILIPCFDRPKTILGDLHILGYRQSKNTVTYSIHFYLFVMVDHFVRLCLGVVYTCAQRYSVLSSDTKKASIIIFVKRFDCNTAVHGGK